MLQYPYDNEDRTKGPPDDYVPVTTMEEVPVLTPEERAALITSLEEAEARVKAGQFIEHDPATLKDRLLNLHRQAKRTQRV
jgi:hypothetical protein